MKSILCLDLDNTLLRRRESEYFSAVIDGLCDHLRVSRNEGCADRINQTIRFLADKNSPGEMLDEAFFAHFARDTALETASAVDSFYDFYRNSYTLLRKFTEPVPEAVAFVDKALNDGHEIVIATNPIYPRIAIEERLKWAGLQNHLNRFLFLTTIENFHFTKPNPAYYAEILGQLGFPENVPVVMVGDSFEMDILPANRAGMKAFLISENNPPENFQSDCSWGSFSDLYRWINNPDHSPAADDQRQQLNLFAFLRASPAVLHTNCKDIPNQVWRFRPGPDEWSMVEIICHLRDADRFVNIPRFKEAFSSENPFLPSIDADAWVTDHNYRDEDGSQALEEMLEARIELLELLESFQGVSWDKTARHSVFGPTSLKELLAFIITHYKIHVNQLQKTHEIAKKKLFSTNPG